MSVQPPLSRTSSSVGVADAVNSPLYWYDDGSVVLVLGHKNKVAFKVHGSVLAQRSNVFKDLFYIPQPAREDCEMAGTCPVIRLADDADDFATFLGLIYTGWEYRIDLSWKVVKALIVFGNKYDIEAFRQEGLAQLERAFPKTIAEWDAVDSGATQSMKYAPADCLAMAEVVRPMGLPDLYAAVLYRCCSLPIDTLFGVGERADPEQDEDVTTPRLHGESLYRCMKGREALLALWLRFSKSLTFGLEPGCRGASSCQRAKEEMRTVTMPRVLRWKYDTPFVAQDLLHVDTRDGLLRSADELGMCWACVDWHRERWNRLRQKSRDMLPQLFGTDWLHPNRRRAVYISTSARDHI